MDSKPDAEAALRAVAGYGPFFTVTLGAPEPGTPSLADLYAGQGLGALLDDLDARLGRVEPRVAASTLFLGWVARLASPLLGCAQQSGLVLHLDPAATFWDTSTLCTTGPRAEALPTADRAGALALTGALIDTHVRPMISALRAEVKVAEPVLLGNTASALRGAIRVMTEQHSTDRATALLRALLAEDGPLAGAARTEPRFRRNNCCLFYRVPGGGLCRDCSLSEVPARR